MRIKLVLLLTIATLVFFAGCSNDGDKEPTITTKSGVVIEASMSNLDIEAPDGTIYKFTIDDDTAFSGEAANLDNTVEITFEGDYKDGAVAKTVATTKVADSTPDMQTKSGIVIDASMGNVEIEAPDGTIYHFTIDDDTTFSGEGDDLGNTIQVSFSGEYKDGVVASTITTTKVREKEAPKTTPKNENSEAKVISGTVIDATMNQVTIQVSSGNEISVAKDDNTHVTGSIIVGSSVEIFYKGTLQDGITAVEISVI